MNDGLDAKTRKARAAKSRQNLKPSHSHLAEFRKAHSAHAFRRPERPFPRRPTRTTFRQPPHKPPPTCRPPRASSASARRRPPPLSPTASRARALSRSTASPSRSSSPRSLDSRSTSLSSSSASTSSVCDYLFSPERQKESNGSRKSKGQLDGRRHGSGDIARSLGHLIKDKLLTDFLFSQPVLTSESASPVVVTLPRFTPSVRLLPSPSYVHSQPTPSTKPIAKQKEEGLRRNIKHTRALST
jgi:hypothetical protein